MAEEKIEKKLVTIRITKRAYKGVALLAIDADMSPAEYLANELEKKFAVKAKVEEVEEEEEEAPKAKRGRKPKKDDDVPRPGRRLKVEPVEEVDEDETDEEDED